ncbi:heme oxygenase 1, chloroplastic-like protein [Tanacetum coccineum]
MCPPDEEESHSIPEPLSLRIDYSLYIEELSKKDPQAFICHFYNTYFAHTVAAKILNRKELEFYKWDCDLPQLLQNVRDKLFKVAKDWTRDEKNHCGGDDDEDDSYEWVADQQSRKMNLHGIKSRSMEINYLLRLKRIRCRWMETNSLLRLKTIRSRWMEAETEENQKSLDGKELAADMDVGWKRIIC